ncbi:hypothetical protein VYU27_009145 [Nannochloropsis oceanica]
MATAAACAGHSSPSRVTREEVSSSSSEEAEMIDLIPLRHFQFSSTKDEVLNSDFELEEEKGVDAERKEKKADKLSEEEDGAGRGNRNGGYA